MAKKTIELTAEGTIKGDTYYSDGTRFDGEFSIGKKQIELLRLDKLATITLEVEQDLVEVPTWFDDWYKKVAELAESPSINGEHHKTIALYLLNRTGFDGALTADRFNPAHYLVNGERYIPDGEETILFTKAILDGYKIKEEPKYLIKISTDSEGDAWYLGKDGQVEFENEEYPTADPSFHFTQSEIKPEYEPFKVEVKKNGKD
ncbi:DUF1642 domain-containing protein [Periweissella cryptocerci]|uniref:DUF1642 domain-containing protein n=1 Tax=Periweissella cryptocerci TaxID=2506420 RepID=A0A4P6YS04_9LACO|nr:DUF1642 domain-containing protein [Periweissella cryptocerci]QBO35400.1 DUF1642 domain-containing protein [Periweissella cryptocerci]